MSERRQKLRTQKSRGVLAISEALEANPRPYRQFGAEAIEGIAILPHEMPSKFPIFARPCPEVPRHGFVESREVESLEELLDVYAEAKKADPKAEVLTMPRLTGKASAIATDVSVVWGLGFDGATGGKAPLWEIPAGSEKDNFTQQMHILLNPKQNSWDVGLRRYMPNPWVPLIKDHAYLELVEHEGEVRLVQFRDGPELPRGTSNYLPQDRYVIGNVIKLPMEQVAQQDMLEWEEKITAAAPGTVVWLPGGSLSSHLAVHGVAKGHAVVTDVKEFGFGAGRELAVGMMLMRRDTEYRKELKKAHFRKMAAMLRDMEYMDLGEVAAPPAAFCNIEQWTIQKSGAARVNKKLIAPSSDVLLSVATMHSLVHWGNDDHLLRLRMFGAMAMCKFLSAACIGEARHYEGQRSGGLKTSAVNWPQLGAPDSKTQMPREWVFMNALRLPLEKLRPLVAGAFRDFQGYWGRGDRRESTGYGGPRWRESAEVTMDLLIALQKFKDVPTKKTWGEVLEHYNKGVNCAHNGGKLLDKFCSWDDINATVNCPQIGFMGPRALMLTTKLGLQEALTPVPLMLCERPNGVNGMPCNVVGGIEWPLAALDWLKAREGGSCACSDCLHIHHAKLLAYMNEKGWKIPQACLPYLSPSADMYVKDNPGVVLGRAEQKAQTKAEKLAAIGEKNQIVEWIASVDDELKDLEGEEEPDFDVQEAVVSIMQDKNPFPPPPTAREVERHTKKLKNNQDWVNLPMRPSAEVALAVWDYVKGGCSPGFVGLTFGLNLEVLKNILDYIPCQIALGKSSDLETLSVFRTKLVKLELLLKEREEKAKEAQSEQPNVE